MFGIEQKIEKAARKGAAFSAAGILGGVGAAFLTAASWMVLVELRSDVFAALVIGGFYLGAAALCAAWGMKRPAKSNSAKQQTPDAEDLSPLQLVALSFIQGFEQGRSNNRTT